ncbi:glycoside hydrolase family 43 protein [Flavihumibacter profundi]|jgi:hypothetical protein|uniref:glycoside hydrolase family 43 protein n=1 Tax=Flavihumibacter profundi TaxID=2716883 RepID=UPI001CC37058|nr:glycoside hydrolase family 43 protein [Flavihumibacter profundi]MBZ5858910.1 glycoside hydrolase family 43 protein [Flavihumibacter profundi]
MTKWPLLFCIFLSFFSRAQKKDSVFLFAYFKNNGEDGLHLASSQDGLKWEALNKDRPFLAPAVAKDKLMRDPCIIRGADGKFHMTWTVSWKDRGIGYASSSDLVHWSAQQFIPVMSDEPGTENCWAPEIFYDAATKQYILYWSSTIPGRFPETANNGDHNHRIYYVTTRDFKQFSKAALLYDGGFNVIDATIQLAGSQYLMFLKDETLRPVPQKNIRIATSQTATSGYSAATGPITGKYWAEGPTAIFNKGRWLVYFDKYTEDRYGAVTSVDLKNWTDISDQVKFPDGARHGTVLRISKDELDRLVKR